MTISREDLESGRLDFSDVATGEVLPPLHPGEVLREEWLVPLAISAYRLSRDLKVPPNRITAILNGERAITADTALRLSRYFGTSPDLWLGLQAAHDLEAARRATGRQIEKEVSRRVA